MMLPRDNEWPLEHYQLTILFECEFNDILYYIEVDIFYGV